MHLLATTNNETTVCEEKQFWHTVSVINIGCRLNQAEGDKLLSVFRLPAPNNPLSVLGILPSETISPSSSQKKVLRIINTCAVTKQAVQTSLKHIRRAIKKSNCRVIVTGCWASIAQKELLKIPGVDGVITQKEKISLIETWEKFLGSIPSTHIDDHSRDHSDSGRIESFFRCPRTRPIVKIQDGCANECSFCLVRLIRGTPRSRHLESILNEIDWLIDLGYKEIVLTGLNLTAYGQDWQKEISANYLNLDTNIQIHRENKLARTSSVKSPLIQLLRSLPDNSCRYRLSSIEPEIFISADNDSLLDDFLDLWSEKRLCRHLHIPLQSGDNNILKLMNRKYTVEDYCRLIDKIYERVPDINIGTDIIVGFPYENDTAFNETVKIIESLPLGYLHVFPYSVRAQTPASKFTDNVPFKVKKERVKILREISQKKSASFRKRFINRKLEFLIEAKPCSAGANQHRNENAELIYDCLSITDSESQSRITLTATSDNYIKLKLPKTNRYQPGNLYYIKIEG